MLKKFIPILYLAIIISSSNLTKLSMNSLLGGRQDQTTAQMEISGPQRFSTPPSLEIRTLLKETKLTETELALEMELDEMALVAQIVQAEAGNQDLDGMRLVADVVLNRMDSDKFPNTAEEVIFQPGQFGPTVDGAFEKAAWNMSQNAYKAVEMEWKRESRLNSGILYFNTSWDNGTNPFKHGAHWFSY